MNMQRDLSVAVSSINNQLEDISGICGWKGRCFGFGLLWSCLQRYSENLNFNVVRAIHAIGTIDRVKDKLFRIVLSAE